MNNVLLIINCVQSLEHLALGFHDLRHSHATIVIQEEGARPDSVQVRLGNSHVSTTLSIYTARFVKQDAKIAKAFDFLKRLK